MKKEYMTPIIGISLFEKENLVTSSGIDKVSDEINIGTLKIDNKSGDNITLLRFTW